MAAWPERHSRRHLPNEQKELLGPATTADSVFKQVDWCLVELFKVANVVSFGCDGGVHGLDVIEALTSMSGKQLQVVKHRSVADLSGLLLAQFDVRLVLCTSVRDTPIAGILDPPHILKRQEEQHASGTHFLQLGPNHYFSFGFWPIAGVPTSIVIKPDPMSDMLTRKAYSSSVMQMLLDNAPATIDPTGTILLLFFTGEAVDAAMFDAMCDADISSPAALPVLVPLRRCRYY